LPHNLDEKLVDTEQSYHWLKYQTISTNYFKNKMLKEETESK